MKNTEYLNDSKEGLKTQRLKRTLKNSNSFADFSSDSKRKPSSKSRNKSCSSRNIRIRNEDAGAREVTSKLKNASKAIFSKFPSKNSEKVKDLK